ncbi:MAG: beta-galactosidase [Lachnospiraceae bacterium]|nr:beta-galactosidase [Lachnospiraceae bacterium]
MTSYSYTPQYLTKDGKPWFPIMGEIHYSRYPKEYWKESIYKMRAGGVEVISSYVIWIHHEEVEKEYDFTGSRDLRSFVQTVKECNMRMILRIGPWSHGEARNGGFPDWLLTKGWKLRTNDADYLAEVKRYYTKIYEQVDGLLLKDGGPIIGVQIENEYGHVGGLQGEEGEQHMRNLTQLAKEVGFDVPIYTATGWGGAVTGGLLPVMGGYCDAPWDASLTDIAPSGNYIFTHERNDHNIGSDHGFGYGLTFDMSKFPFLTAELGGGLQVTHHRRPVAHSKDIGAMTMVKLGSGVNLLGYYMYHGGTNPEGKLTTLQETKATGYPNDLPELNYDFRAPIREYGQVSETLKEVKLITSFIRDFGSELCEMPAVIPEDNPLHPTDLEHYRYSFRQKGNRGYLFINNYQRRQTMAPHRAVVFKAPAEGEEIVFPPIDIEDKDYFFYPYNMKLGSAVLKTALATPFCKLENDITTYVFYTDKDPQYRTEGELVGAELLTLSREEAKNAWKIVRDKEYLFISDSAVIDEDDRIVLFGRKKPAMKVYPALTETPEGFVRLADENGFAVYERSVPMVEDSVSFSLVEETAEKAVYDISLKVTENVADSYLVLCYGGDTAKLYMGEKLIADHFYQGEPWEISLRRFRFPSKLRLEITALQEGAPRFLEAWPQMKDGRACVLDRAELQTEYQTSF